MGTNLDGHRIFTFWRMLVLFSQKFSAIGAINKRYGFTTGHIIQNFTDPISHSRK
jgi:hypothetical protein